ncbi:MAG: hypothetical protein CMH56_03910 [Myxococcales bacterium]|nr:hypothetical protein [Myxococcales bacterium]|tara:strand:+ start:3163 stop:3543 length:381 start_codon:yes stop_codon:yes gene_type:complete
MRANNLYKQQSLKTASQEQIMILLFKKALANLKVLEKGDLKDTPDEHFKLGENTIDIVVELRQTLNHDVAPELCKQLEDLYNYIISRLAVGLTNYEAKPFKESINVLEPIVEAFTAAVQNANQQTS